jgi:perosamine synthetase
LKGRHVGTFGVLGAFSFYAHKTITTGEGGMVVTNDSRVADRVTLLRNQGQSPTRRYWHVVAGFNYRMTNMCAAIGVAQLERLASIIARKRAIASQYRDLLADDPVSFQSRRLDVESAEWLVSVLLPRGVDRDQVIDLMAADGVETRPAFYCAHQMPMYAASLKLPVAVEIAERGISLPSYPQMSEADVARVVAALRSAIGKASAVRANGVSHPWTAGRS